MVDPEQAIEKARKAVTERAELPGMSLMEGEVMDTLVSGKQSCIRSASPKG